MATQKDVEADVGSRARRAAIVGACTVMMALAVVVLVCQWPHLIQTAASMNTPQDASDPHTFDQLTNAVGEIDKDALIADGIVTPLACIVGAVGMMLGNQRGSTIIFTSLGVLGFIGTIQGIVK